MADCKDAADDSEMSPSEIEKLEEAKLKARFPITGKGPLSGHSAFLQKRLAKGQKFFDSGDYNMARQNQNQKQAPKSAPVPAAFSTGDAIPTPDTVPARKTSIIQPKFPSNAT